MQNNNQRSLSFFSLSLSLSLLAAGALAVTGCVSFDGQDSDELAIESDTEAGVSPQGSGDSLSPGMAAADAAKAVMALGCQKLFACTGDQPVSTPYDTAAECELYYAVVISTEDLVGRVDSGELVFHEDAAADCLAQLPTALAAQSCASLTSTHGHGCADDIPECAPEVSTGMFGGVAACELFMGALQ